MPFLAPKVRDDLEYFDQVIEGDDMVLVRDPIRGSYFRFNPLQAAMLRNLDGQRSASDITAVLSAEYDVEIPPAAAERFIARARELMLLDITSYSATPEAARKQVTKALRKAGFRLRSPDAVAVPRQLSAESMLFAEAFRQLDLGHPRAAAGYLAEILQTNPGNVRARQLYELIQKAYIRAAGGMTDFPTVVLFNPSRMLTWMSRVFGRFLFGWAGIIAMILYAVVGLYAYNLVTFEGLTSLGPFDIVVAVTLYLIGGFVHEVGHGLACQHYGGNVTEIGFTFFYYIKPAAYCDTSSSYQINERKHKVIVQLAGMVASIMFVASIMIALAVMSPSVPIYKGIAVEILLEAAFALMTLIPFMKLDGYYAICDFFGFPNMRDRSFKLLRSWVSQSWFGIESPSEELPRRTRAILIIYAALSFAFTVWFIYVGYFRLLSPLVEHLRATGLFIAVVLSAYLLRNLTIRPLWAGIRLLVRERRRVFTLRRSLVYLVIATAVIGPWFIERPVPVDAPFTLVPSSRAEIRAQVAGQVEQILVADGESVHKGQPLAVLRDTAMHAKVGLLVTQLDAAKILAAKVRAGARDEEVAVARGRAQLARAEVHRTAEAAAVASSLANSHLGTASRADTARSAAATTQGNAVAAEAALALVQRGARPEDIAMADADIAQLEAELAHLRSQEALLTLRSPIDGIVVTPHLSDKLQVLLKPGETFAEVEDLRSIVAEIALSASDPLAQIRVGNDIVLRPYSDPHVELRARVDHIREAAVTAGDANALVVVTTPFELERPVVGATGHARIYGEERSLAYAKLYLPLERFVRVQLWQLW